MDEWMDEWKNGYQWMDGWMVCEFSFFSCPIWVPIGHDV
jgi:hypothetical protein